MEILKNEDGKIVSREVKDIPIDPSNLLNDLAYHQSEVDRIKGILSQVNPIIKDDPAVAVDIKTAVADIALETAEVAEPADVISKK